MQNLNRRSFLWAASSFGLVMEKGKSKSRSETVYRFLTPECEVRMSVEYFGNLNNSFGFRDVLTDRGFCLSANGEENQNCLQRFSGSMAIAVYHFRSRLRAQMPIKVRERVLTIDHDSRMNPRPPFERDLAVEREVVSDIQAFGYNQDDPEGAASKSFAVWCLLRQDLYLNDQNAPFLIVHWKHTLSFISLVDVIPGDRTQLIAG